MNFVTLKEYESDAEYVKVPLEEDRLPLITVKETFSKYDGLFYRFTGELRAVGLLSGDDVLKEPFFKEPEGGWAGREFFVRKAPCSRPLTPMVVDYPFEQNNEMEIIEQMKRYVYTVDGIVACATAVGVNVLASCYHCIKHCVTTGPSVDEINSHREAIIGLTHPITGHKVKAKIRIYSIERDVVLLETSEEDKLIADGELGFREAWLGQPYYILGTPISDDGNELQLISGRISAVFQPGFSKTSAHSLHGHGSARPGASGGPVFARRYYDGRPTLLGIIMAGQNITHDTKLLTFVSSNYVKIISIMTLREIYCQQNVFKFEF